MGPHRLRDICRELANGGSAPIEPISLIVGAHFSRSFGSYYQSFQGCPRVDQSHLEPGTAIEVPEIQFHLAPNILDYKELDTSGRTNQVATLNGAIAIGSGIGGGHNGERKWLRSALGCFHVPCERGYREAEFNQISGSQKSRPRLIRPSLPRCQFASLAPLQPCTLFFGFSSRIAHFVCRACSVAASCVVTRARLILVLTGHRVLSYS